MKPPTRKEGSLIDMLVMATLMPLAVGFLQVGDGGIRAQGGDGDAVHALGHVGLDQFGLFGLVVVGVGGQHFDAVLLAGVLIALDHAVHELVILKDDSRRW